MFLKVLLTIIGHKYTEEVEQKQSQMSLYMAVIMPLVSDDNSYRNYVHRTASTVYTQTMSERELSSTNTAEGLKDRVKLDNLPAMPYSCNKVQSTVAAGVALATDQRQEQPVRQQCFVVCHSCSHLVP